MDSSHKTLRRTTRIAGVFLYIVFVSQLLAIWLSAHYALFVNPTSRGIWPEICILLALGALPLIFKVANGQSFTIKAGAFISWALVIGFSTMQSAATFLVKNPLYVGLARYQDVIILRGGDYYEILLRVWLNDDELWIMAMIFDLRLSAFLVGALGVATILSSGHFKEPKP